MEGTGKAKEDRRMSVSRVYADVVSNMPPDYADYDSVNITWE